MDKYAVDKSVALMKKSFDRGTRMQEEIKERVIDLLKESVARAEKGDMEWVFLNIGNVAYYASRYQSVKMETSVYDNVINMLESDE